MRPILSLILIVILGTPLSRAQSPTGDTSTPSNSGAETPAPAVAPGLSADVAKKLLERVEKLQKDFDQQKHEVITSAIARLSTAAGNDAAAIALYLGCRRIIAERTAVAQDAIATKKPTAKDAQDKGKREEQMRDNLEEPGHGAVLRLQAEYLMITLEAPQSKDRAMLVGRVRDFVNKAMNVIRLSITAPMANAGTGKKPVATIGSKSSDRERERERQLQIEMRSRRVIPQQLQQSVMSTPFAQAYNLANYLQKIEGWVDAPLSLSSIYPTFLLPYYRANRRADLVGVWDEYLTHSLSMQRALLDDAPFARWGITEYKQMQWDKWCDLLINGSNPSVASDELANLFHDNPTHPNIAQWLESLKAIAEPYKPAPTPSEEEPSTKSPAAATPEAPFKF